MPPKRAPQYTKPVTDPHPSLTPSSSSKGGLHASTAESSTTSSSVNDLIQQYRRSQISNLAERSRDDANPHTVHPSLRAILNVPETPAPQPRSGMRVVGPPPPRSWLNDTAGASAGLLKTRRGMNNSIEGIARKQNLPGLKLPKENSLLHMALKALAKNWPWHQEYDQYYLATLPVRHKEALISYIASYSPQSLDLRGLELLFLGDEELEDATGSESVTHLDFAASVGFAINIKDIKNFFTKKQAPTEKRESALETDVPESWDSPLSTINTSISVPRFPALTHLSFSRAADPSWKHLLGLLPHLATLTHLSLAYWPIPSLTPNETTAYRETPAGNINYGASNYYSLFDGDLDEVTGVLRRLSKATYCLRWLDLTGCGKWLQALGRENGADWCGAWRGMEVVNIGQGWMPSILVEEGSQWRPIIEQKVSEDEAKARALKKMREELTMWADGERTITLIDKLVNSIRTRIHNGKSSSVGSNLGPTSSRVHFDRGWRGWWIEDALSSINALAMRDAAHFNT